MTVMTCRRWVATAAFVASTMVGASVAAIGTARAEMVVIASTAPGIGAGLMVAAGDRLTVPDGAVVTLIDQTGRSVTINGPFSDLTDQPATAGGDGVMVAVASLLSAPDEYDEFGATRGVRVGEETSDGGDGGDGAGDAPAGMPVEAIDLDRGGVHCVTDGAPRLWRQDASESARYTLKADGLAEPIRVSFAAGAHGAPWPEAIALTAGTIDITRVDRAAAPAAVEIKIVPREAKSEPELIAALAVAGCESQAARHAAALRASLAPLSLYLASDRGREASYRLGDKMTLVAQASRDVYLYCFYRDSQGAIVTLFPSRYSKGALVRGNTALRLPGARLPVTLEFAAPPGREEVRCFATTRDMSDRLPKTVTAGAFEPLTAARATEIGAIFSEISESEVAEAKIDLTVK